MDDDNTDGGIFCFTSGSFEKALHTWLDRKLDADEEHKRSQVVNAFSEFLASAEAEKLRVNTNDN